MEVEYFISPRLTGDRSIQREVNSHNNSSFKDFQNWDFARRRERGLNFVFSTMLEKGFQIARTFRHFN